jgi:aminopeptidase C
MQRHENVCKRSFFNYESPALTAELQARVAHRVKHSTSLMTNPESIRGCSNR